MAVYLFFCRFSECYTGKGQQRTMLENHTDVDIHTLIQCQIFNLKSIRNYEIQILM